MLSILTRKLIKAESKLKLAEDSENNRSFRESEVKIIQIYPHHLPSPPPNTIPHTHTHTQTHTHTHTFTPPRKY